MSSQNKKPRVFNAAFDPLECLSRLRKHCEVIDDGGRAVISYDSLKRSVVDMDALIIDPLQTINSEVLDCAGSRLKIIATISTGLEHIDLEECKRRGIKVGYAPDAPVTAVAEMTLALALTTARRLVEARQSIYDGEWQTNAKDLLWMAGKQISGSVIGIVGLGRIGFAAAKRFKSFEPSKIVYCGHEVKPYASEIGAEFVAFKDLLAMSDFVIITCSLNSTTENLFNAEVFEQMKNSSILVNVSRGGIVDHDALCEALLNKQIAAAGLDVTCPEPLPKDHKLLSLPNCIIIPHRGCSTKEVVHAKFSVTTDNILAGLKDEPLPCAAY